MTDLEIIRAKLPWQRTAKEKELLHIAEPEAEEARGVARRAAEAEQRLDEPVSRRELLEVIAAVRAKYAGSGTEPRDTMADALGALAEELK
ncbi:hypothetical protein [Rhodopseudomonas pseudopalustris]|uniref:Uncharacterized protein n=1 Tax=Rhodopseudomonas pseudopalustris TaxID=1513892 RepID=A0A1H8WIC8_9BRAD|nr:hypothetical protein [Rhodopseudomonas pseudopalustris]SEP27177.1 hypothetical protein SAMN05444123_112104 [Rhodopseudomonas pseudopalustris]